MTPSGQNDSDPPARSSLAFLLDAWEDGFRLGGFLAGFALATKLPARTWPVHDEPGPVDG